jgi:hypothetical protein
MAMCLIACSWAFIKFKNAIKKPADGGAIIAHFVDIFSPMPIQVFMAAIAAMGVVRFAMTVAGLPNHVVKFASMSVIMLVAFLYFAIVSKTHIERLKAAYLIVLPYMIVEVAALGYTWASGRQTIFHAKEYSLGTGIGLHTIGHFVGGLTWEPLAGFVFMEIVWFVAGRAAVLAPLRGAGGSKTS